MTDFPSLYPAILGLVSFQPGCDRATAVLGITTGHMITRGRRMTSVWGFSLRSKETFLRGIPGVFSLCLVD
jgi:hypothetical protein